MNKTVNGMRGVTLIELMIVVVIVGILAAIAYPSFQDQVRKSRRADGKAALMEAAQVLERCYTRSGTYVGCTFDALSDDEFYAISAVGALAPSSFTLQAAPQGDQAKDTDCGTLRLTNLAVQGSQGADTDTNGCW